MRANVMWRGLQALLASAVVIGAGGCSTWKPDHVMVGASLQGEHQVARERAAARLANDPRDRNYALGRVRLAMADLANGQVEAAEIPFLATYDILRVQGINDKKSAPIFFGTEEGQKVWKGDPFEIAAALAYFSAQLAAVEDWDNARAAADQSLFLLADFQQTIGGATDTSQPQMERVYRETEARAAAARQAGNTAEASFDAQLDKGYQPVETNFGPGYFMVGLANVALARYYNDDTYLDAARDNFRKLREYAPGALPAAEAILSGQANTVFWVDFGKGPEKYRTGYANAFSEYRAIDRSDGSFLASRVNGLSAASTAPAADFNSYAMDLRWRAYQELRLAKALLGDALIVGGAVVAARAESAGEALVGLGMVIAGAIAKKNAEADIRHNELLPQRTYFVAVPIARKNSTVELQVEGRPESRMVLAGLDPPDSRSGVQFRYVRLVSGALAAPEWATSGVVHYASDAYVGRVADDDLPFIFGGRCVRAPTQAAFDRYLAGGRLPSMTLVELQNLYRAEGITWDLSDQGGLAERHVLEGGRSLISPQAGTAGFARIFGRVHPPYSPRSGELKAFLSEHHDHFAGTMSIADHRGR